ncbi:hypothetical protein RvY_13518-1 [Ramazzottius varieornatus]|uniref:Ion transport domain-containing protein n=1 Tax=Ramazzottius varieornatus TaxID=947166 RepID=A0A1D1VN51_RAMVA|nr:hypothetical protein RvY_13518-1 [Ramazzottius varieornatus]
MRRPENVMVHHLVSEILFFGLGQDVLERFLHDEDMLFLKKPVPKNPLQRQLWDMFEYPASSRWAKMVAAVNVVLVIMAVINTCVQTLPEYRESDPLQCSPNNRSSEYAIEGVTSEGMTGFFAVEILCNSWFLVDLVIRLTATPTRRTFFCQIMNIIDVLSIVPFVFDLGLYLSGTVEDPDAPAGGLVLLVVLRLFRILRIFRILKLSRYSDGLEILWLTLKSARQELTVMFLLVSIGLTVFSGAIYAAEFGHPKSDFHSIPDSFWWTIITGTSVGYGDMIPKRPIGKLIGAVCSVSGVICLAFFVPIVVAHFEYYFHHGKELKRLQDVLDQYNNQQTDHPSEWKPYLVVDEGVPNPKVTFAPAVDLETGEKLH